MYILTSGDKFQCIFYHTKVLNNVMERYDKIKEKKN